MTELHPDMLGGLKFGFPNECVKIKLIARTARIIGQFGVGWGDADHSRGGPITER